LQVICRITNTVTTITARRLEWAGHGVRMSDDDKCIKKVFHGETRWKEKNRETKIKVVRLY
jgi:hypothetical protein